MAYSRRPYTDDQAPIVAKLSAGGDRLVGPVTCSRTGRARAWGWRDGRPVNGNAVAGLIERGVLVSRPGQESEREAVLRGS